MGSPLGADSFGNYGTSNIDTGGQNFDAWLEQEKARRAAEEAARLAAYLYTNDGKYRRTVGGGPVERIDPETGQWAGWNTGGNSLQHYNDLWSSVKAAEQYKREMLGKTLGEMDVSYKDANGPLNDYLRGLKFGPVTNNSFGINVEGPGVGSADVLGSGSGGWERNAIPLLDADGNVAMYWTPSSTLDPAKYGDDKASETFSANPAYANAIRSGYWGKLPTYGEGYFINPTADAALDAAVGNRMSARTFNNPPPSSLSLGTLGTVAGLAGMALGVPALGMLGKGLSLASAIDSGNPLGILGGAAGLAGFNPFGAAGDAMAGVDPSEWGMGASMGWNDLPTSAFDTGAMADAFSNIPSQAGLEALNSFDSGAMADAFSNIPTAASALPTEGLLGAGASILQGPQTMGDVVSGYDPTDFLNNSDSVLGSFGPATFDPSYSDVAGLGDGAWSGWSLDPTASTDSWGSLGIPQSMDTGNGIGETIGGTAASAPAASSWWNTIKGIGGTAKEVLDAVKPYAGLLGAGAGAAAAAIGSKSDSKPAGETTTTTVPWAAQQPYLLDLFAKAKAAQQGTAGLSPLQQAAMASATTMANNPLTGPAQGLIGQAIGGNLKNPYAGTGNPYLEDTITKANEDVNRAMQPAIAQANRASGSFGNSGVAETYGRAMSDQFSKNATGLRFQDYTQQQNLAENDINRRLTAAYNVPSFNANNLATTQNLYNLGGLAKNDPFDSLGKYGSLIGGQYGNATSTPYFQNNMAGLLGGALAGAQLFPSLFKSG